MRLRPRAAVAVGDVAWRTRASSTVWVVTVAMTRTAPPAAVPRTR